MRTLVTLGIIASLHLGCTGGGDDSGPLGPDPADPGPSALTTRDQLMESPVLTLIPIETDVALAARLPRADSATFHEALPLQEGRLAFGLSSDGSLQLDEMTLAFGDIRIAPTRLDLGLTDIHAEIAGPATAETTWVGDDEAYGELAVMVDLDWSLVTEDGAEPWPLEQQEIGPLVLNVSVSSAGGRLAVDLSGGIDGTFFRWGSLAELADLEMQSRAVDNR